MLNLPHAPATSRNREPIFSVLAPFLKQCSSLLEIASGTGEHAAWMAPKLPSLQWQPSDYKTSTLEVINAYNQNNENVLPALQIDVHQEDWSVTPQKCILCINMIHIAPFTACEALLAGADRYLLPSGLLCFYGPFRRNAMHTAPSNARFDQSLRARNPLWGLRDLEEVEATAQKYQLELIEVIDMPANNFVVIFQKMDRSN